MTIASLLLIAAAMLSPSYPLPSPPARNLRGGRRPRLRRLQQQQRQNQNQSFCPQCIWSGNIVCEARANFLVDNYGDLTLEEAREDISDVCSSEDGLPPDDDDPPAIPSEFFCGVCPWKSMNFNCDSRVAFIEENYFLSTEKAREDLMESGECIDPAYVASNVTTDPNANPNDAPEKSTNNDPLSIVLFCGPCAWRGSDATCDEKALSLATADGGMTLEQAKISILADCFQDDPEANKGRLPYKWEVEPESAEGFPIWAIVVILAVAVLVLLLCIRLAVRRTKRSKEEEQRGVLMDFEREASAAETSERDDASAVVPATSASRFGFDEADVDGRMARPDPPERDDEDDASNAEEEGSSSKRSELADVGAEEVAEYFGRGDPPVTSEGESREEEASANAEGTTAAGDDRTRADETNANVAEDGGGGGEGSNGAEMANDAVARNGTDADEGNVSLATSDGPEEGTGNSESAALAATSSGEGRREEGSATMGETVATDRADADESNEGTAGVTRNEESKHEETGNASEDGASDREDDVGIVDGTSGDPAKDANGSDEDAAEEARNDSKNNDETGHTSDESMLGHEDRIRIFNKMMNDVGVPPNAAYPPTADDLGDGRGIPKVPQGGFKAHDGEDTAPEGT